jgi:transforming growth factor-beta-induced protein
LAPQVTKMNSVKTLNGQSLAIKVNDGTVMVDNAKVIKTDILCSNGVIHVIDSVILPK